MPDCWEVRQARIDRKPLLYMSFGGGALITWPVMTTVAGATSMTAVFFILLGAMLMQTGYIAINAVLKAELHSRMRHANGTRTKSGDGHLVMQKD